MQQNPILAHLFHEIEEAEFQLYTPEEIEKISVVQINNPDARTPMDTYQANSYLDPRMGVFEPFVKCITCGKQMNECQGHIGHIRLIDHLYNPVTFPLVAKLFSKQCQYCHCLRISPAILRKFEVKLACIRAGLAIQAEMCDTYNNEMLEKAERAALQQLEAGEPAKGLLLKQLHKDTVRDLFASVTAKCPMCGQYSDKLLSQSGIKIFRVQDQELQDNGECEEMPDAVPALEQGQADKRYTFLLPSQVYQELSQLYNSNRNLFINAYGKQFSISSLFLKNLPITPSRNRPPRFLQGRQFDSPISSTIAKIITLNNEMLGAPQSNTSLQSLVELQLLINQYIDTSKCQNSELQGLRQSLEKKQGLFRKNIQGKRVNFAARSVISPDINLATSEVGIPDKFAKTLTFPEPVNENNVEFLKTLVKNGPEYPGANFLEADGKMFSLADMPMKERIIHAEMLLQRQPGSTVIVHRHVMPGDPVLFNRQPSLHRLSMMAHKARILPGQSKTMRFHYANCDSYNADFDGDEMNLHMLESYPQQAEALELALNDKNYISVTSGEAYRGLIQDSVVGGTLLTKLDCFLNKNDFQQYCWMACSQKCREAQQLTIQEKVELLKDLDKVGNSNPFSATTDVKFLGNFSAEKKRFYRSNGDGYQYCSRDSEKLYFGTDSKEKDEKKKVIALQGQQAINIPQPTILYPQTVYTGKQTVSVMLDSICGQKKISIKQPNSLPADTWGVQGQHERLTRVINNELVTGLVDKRHIAAKQFSLVHSIQEVCGGEQAGQFITGYGKLAEFVLQRRGFTCGIEDMILNQRAEDDRINIYEHLHENSVNATNQFLNSNTDDVKALKAGLQVEFRDKKRAAQYDAEIQTAAQQITTAMATACKPINLITQLPRNSLAFMIQAGAKGSTVNLQMMTCCLGQQCLEGKRVPITPIGRTLPCFRPYSGMDFIPGGYVFDRFLTGIRPQSFFFHLQAGREGLIDTAVKTANSGYLQRCIIKSAEGLRVAYDGTVRDADGTMVQQYYGGDGLDPCKTAMLDRFDFLARNGQNYLQSSTRDKSVESLKKLIRFYEDNSYQQLLAQLYKYDKELKKIQKYYLKISGKELHGEELVKETYQLVELSKTEKISSILSPYLHFGSCNPSYYDKILAYQQQSPLLQENAHFVNNNPLTKEQFERNFYQKYRSALVSPGEAVGVTTGQSIGEPSTQLTLNTFHLAGHGAANVTLGIPRLREIVMAAKKQISTPLITIQCPNVGSAEQISLLLNKITLKEMIKHLYIKESIKGQYRCYHAEFECYDPQGFKDLTPHQFQQAICNNFANLLVKSINKHIQSQNNQKLEEGEEEILQRVHMAEDNNGMETEAENVNNEESSSTESSETSQSDNVADGNAQPQAECQQQEAKESSFDFCFTENDEPIYRNTQKFVIFKQISFANNKLVFQFAIGIEQQVLLLSILEQIIDRMVIKQQQGINKAFIRQSSNETFVDIEGNALEILFKQEQAMYDFHAMKCNDIYKILQIFGVEAARAAIIKEVSNVFEVYHIGVDYHHLSIVADYMTQDGNYRAFNRSGISSTPHVLLKSSFETSSNFVVEAAVYGEKDMMTTASGTITVGKPIPSGTGCFDLLQDI